MNDQRNPAGSDSPRVHDLMEIFNELSFREKWRRVFRGIRQPRETGEFKYARLQLQRLGAPVAAVIVPVLFMAMMMVFATMAPPPERAVSVMLVEPEAVEQLDDIEEILDEPLEPPEPIEMDFPSEVTVTTDTPLPQPATDFSPQPAEFDAVAMVRSPVIMRGIFGSRSPGARGKAMAEFGGSGITEGAVIRALRWLKREQQEDGSWKGYPLAFASLGLLTFLAHGETPASEEFGQTVEKAIRFIVSQRRDDGNFPGNYEIPIAAYAICEAYALTRIPMLREVAEGVTDWIIKGQHPTGGWDYRLGGMDTRRTITRTVDGQQETVPNPMFGKYRDDTSYMAWCAQALKAAHLAGLRNEGLERAMRLAVDGFKKNAHPEGGFGYTSPGRGGLTSAGVLSMQLMGAMNEPETRRGLAVMEDWVCNFREPHGPRPFYYWYYATQAKFHAGGRIWRNWNRQFAEQLVRNQKVLKGAGEDGKDIGYWEQITETEGYGLVYNTTLCALMLQVYYRYLPTFRTPQEIAFDEDLVSEDDIEVQITL